jgi:putative ABC transport system ATP-binding protein
MILKTENLNKLFRTDEVETTALNDVNIQVEEGEFTSIMARRVAESPRCFTYSA